jgi:hypothetical protein
MDMCACESEWHTDGAGAVLKDLSGTKDWWLELEVSKDYRLPSALSLTSGLSWTLVRTSAFVCLELHLEPLPVDLHAVHRLIVGR